MNATAGEPTSIFGSLVLVVAVFWFLQGSSHDSQTAWTDAAAAAAVPRYRPGFVLLLQLLQLLLLLLLLHLRHMCCLLCAFTAGLLTVHAPAGMLLLPGES